MITFLIDLFGFLKAFFRSPYNLGLEILALRVLYCCFFRHDLLHAIPPASDNGQFGHLAFVAFLPRDMAREVLLVAAGEFSAIVCAAAEFFPLCGQHLEL